MWGTGTAVAPPDQPQEPRRDRPAGATHAQRGAVSTLGHHLQARIAGQPPGRLRCHLRTGLQVGHALLTTSQHLRLHMQDHRRPVGVAVSTQPLGRQLHEGVGATGLVALELARLGIGRHGVGQPLEGPHDDRSLRRRQPAPEVQLLLVVPPAPHRPARPALVPAQPPGPASDRLRVGRRPPRGRFGQLGVVIGGGETGEGRHLVPRQPARTVGGGDGRQGLERPGDPHPTGRGRRRDAETPSIPTSQGTADVAPSSFHASWRSKAAKT